MTPFRWKNCYADILTYKHGMTIESYFNDVIIPALATLDEKIGTLENIDEPGAVFAHHDMKDILRESKLAFCLAIHSIWERQLRAYLRGCANELHLGDTIGAKIDKAVWKELCKYFRELRNIDLKAFPSFDSLDVLQHLGNACRHGDGNSATELARRCPDLWPDIPRLAPMQQMPPGSPWIELPRTVDRMDIPVVRLRSLVLAIAQFWRDVEYIYNESIEQKDTHLEARLATERVSRSWVPQAPAEGG
ncbi:hypothetical protein NML43_24610 [Rhodopseudomonas palustris]|uniref:hypothetical protein n=1 Tax=Rhodopseudomonas palustris TaxID=1076 RepID=UPI0020CDF50F|nr:hypothetical protein [Rhodopseudomonas palustris]MCP9630287.1 hypothetical protein [Rhodopseudomonas palustris]